MRADGKRNTLVVNLFGGPGTGKSTMMAAVFAKLKSMEYDCEMCPEFAKELVWENRLETFSDELYLFAKQNHRLFRLIGKVDIVITDRPLYLSIPYYNYYKGRNETYERLVKDTFDSYENLNIFLERRKEFVQNGRNESEEESKAFDERFKECLDEAGYSYATFPGDISCVDEICKCIVNYYDIVILDDEMGDTIRKMTRG